MPSAQHTSAMFVELGLAILGLALLARIAHRFRFSAIPLYLLAGLAFGKGGLAPLDFSESFIRVGAEIGVLLLLFMLGLEYTGEELKRNLSVGIPAGLVDFALNFPPGLIAGLLLGWRVLPSVLLGGITYISSSGVIARILSELRRMDNAETPAVLSILVLEDLAMAIYLPIVAVLLSQGSTRTMLISVAIALVTVGIVLVIAVRYGSAISRMASSESDEIILLTTFGAVLLVAGVAQRFHVSAAIGAFLVGIAVSGQIATQSHRLLSPLRDLFSATFFFFFGLQIDPGTLPRVLPYALVLGVVTASTKVLTGYWTAQRMRVDRTGAWRAGVALIARGEFSIVIAGLGMALEPRLEPLAAAYVLLLAIAGPLLARVVR
jgi:monovalent cation:H+ antiporter-2, CPA2 family